MPFDSKAQQGYMYAHPEILGKKALHEWSGKTDFSKLPEHVHHKHAPYALAHEARKKNGG